MRKNEKKQVFSYENTIRKSNEFSMAKLSQKLTLNQMQLLAYAIFSTQQNGKTEFIKAEFEKKFDLGEYRREDAREDNRKLFELEFSLDDIEGDEFDFLHVFQRINYKDGLFTFKWSEDMVPHILDLKDRYITNGLLTIANFKSGFSWILYDYLKAHYGYWHKPLSKEALMKLFGVENRKSYVNSTAQFKRGVFDIAIAEINKFTELEVWYKEEKKGRSIIGFDLIWSAGTNQTSATQKQIKELKAIVDVIHDDMFKYININDEKKRNQAIVLVRQMETMKIHTEDPICITKERADKLLVDADYVLKKLERLAEKDKNGKFYYNWLEK